MLKFFGMKYTAAILSTNTRKLKINKSCCHQSCTFWLQYALNRLSAGASSQIPLGELTALLRPPAGFRGPASKGLGEEEESSSFAVERKRKVGAREHEIGHKTGTETRTNKNVANSTAYSVTDRQTDWVMDWLMLYTVKYITWTRARRHAPLNVNTPSFNDSLHSLRLDL